MVKKTPGGAGGAETPTPRSSSRTGSPAPAAAGNEQASKEIDIDLPPAESMKALILAVNSLRSEVAALDKKHC